MARRESSRIAHGSTASRRRCVSLHGSAARAVRTASSEPASTTSTTRIVLSGTDANNAAVINVYDGSYNLLGTLPNTTRAVALYQDATPHVFAYTYDSASSQALRYDLTASQSGGAYSSIASAPAANPGASVRMAISPDGGTLFIAGSSQIVVQPAP